SHASFTAAALGVGISSIRAVDLQEPRTALGGAYVQAGVASPTYTDPTLTVGATSSRRSEGRSLPEATASNPGCSRALLLGVGRHFKSGQTLTVRNRPWGLASRNVETQRDATRRSRPPLRGP